jgi:hypothetical protein
MQGLTNEVADVEGLVAGPKQVVDVGVPPMVGAHDVVHCGVALNCETGECGSDQELRHCQHGGLAGETRVMSEEER